MRGENDCDLQSSLVEINKIGSPVPIEHYTKNEKRENRNHRIQKNRRLLEHRLGRVTQKCDIPITCTAKYPKSISQKG